MKHVFLILVCALSASTLFCAEPLTTSLAPCVYPSRTDSAYILRLLQDELPVAPGVKKAKIKASFGNTWDFITPLRHGEGTKDGTFKKRLNALKNALITVCDVSVLSPEERVRSLELSEKMSLFSRKWAALDATKESLHADDLYVHGYSPIKEYVISEQTTSSGVVFTNINQQNIVHVTDPDAVTLLLSLCKLQVRKKSPSFKEISSITAQFLNSSDLSEQSRAVVAFALGSACAMSPELNLRVLRTSQASSPLKAVTTIPLLDGLSQQDTKKVFGALANLPHYTDVVAALGEYTEQLVESDQKLYTIENKQIILHPGLSKLYRTFCKYLPIIDQLTDEYTNAYQRVKIAIKRGVYSHPVKSIPVHQSTVQSVEPILALISPAVDSTATHNESMSDQPVRTQQAVLTSAAQQEKRTFRYDPRVLRWFNPSFTQTQPLRSKRYHTLLPLSCDVDLIMHGEHTTWNNKTIHKQKDDLYRLPGKVTFDDGTSDYYIFEACLDQNKTCYHRGCKAVPFDQLVQELSLAPEMFETLDTNSHTETMDAHDESSIISESALSKVIRNPQHGCTITLYKMLT